MTVTKVRVNKMRRDSLQENKEIWKKIMENTDELTKHLRLRKMTFTKSKILEFLATLWEGHSNFKKFVWNTFHCPVNRTEAVGYICHSKSHRAGFSYIKEHQSPHYFILLFHTRWKENIVFWQKINILLSFANKWALWCDLLMEPTTH